MQMLAAMQAAVPGMCARPLRGGVRVRVRDGLAVERVRGDEAEGLRCRQGGSRPSPFPLPRPLVCRRGG